MVRREIQTAVNRLTVLAVVVGMILSGSSGVVALAGGGGPAATADSTGIQQSVDERASGNLQDEGNRPCGFSTGDPHLITFDGVAYDFQKSGEFDLVNTSQFTAQVRQESLNGRDVTYNTGFAVEFDDTTIIINKTGPVTLRINGTKRIIENKTLTPGGANLTIAAGDGVFFLALPGPDGVVDSGDTRIVVAVEGDHLEISVCVDLDDTGPIRGLLGSPDGNTANDIQTRDGDRLQRPVDGDKLYGEFASSWSVNLSTSLFRYKSGQGPNTYYNQNAPSEVVTISDFPQSEVDAARDKAETAGLEPGTLNFRNGVLDYLVTGDEQFFESAKFPPTMPDDALVEITELDGEEPTPSGALRAGYTAPDRRTAD
jgi:hypothetical protein